MFTIYKNADYIIMTSLKYLSCLDVVTLLLDIRWPVARDVGLTWGALIGVNIQVALQHRSGAQRGLAIQPILTRNTRTEFITCKDVLCYRYLIMRHLNYASARATRKF